MDFDRLVAEHKDAIYRQMVRVCGDRDDADDALVEALGRAYRSLDRLREPEAFRSWLTQIGRRVCLRMRRRNPEGAISLEAMLSAGLPEPQTPGTDEDAELAATKRCILAAIDALSELDRRVYWQRDVEGRSATEVAEALGLTVPAVKARLHRARLQLRQQLNALFG
ncbi:MAG TPA: sigma-70 family RNA polymerase sigma factor [Fimbriimonadaceae bacterium]|nr:sigma-70 family RNA polymerase sigma factor [Fimbriimonadaceae bacterium]